MAKVGFNKNYNMNRVVKKLIATLIGLWVGGTIVTEFGNVMNSTCSPFYKGLSLIGWTVGSATCTTTGATDANTITATSSSGILSVVGIVGLASVVMEFVNFKM